MINVEKKGKNLGGGGVVVKGGLVLIRLRMGGLMKTNLAKGSLSLLTSHDECFCNLP